MKKKISVKKDTVRIVGKKKPKTCFVQYVLLLLAVLISSAIFAENATLKAKMRKIDSAIAHIDIAAISADKNRLVAFETNVKSAIERITLIEKDLDAQSFSIATLTKAKNTLFDRISAIESVRETLKESTNGEEKSEMQKVQE